MKIFAHQQKSVFLPVLKKWMYEQKAKEEAVNKNNPWQFLKNPLKVYVKKEGSEISCVILHARRELYARKTEKCTWKNLS